MTELLATPIDPLFKWFLLAFAALFPIINPPGTALIFLSMTRRATRAQRAALARRVALYSLLIINASYFVGVFVLELFGISVAVLRVGGGIVVAVAGWRLLNAPRQDEPAASDRGARDVGALAFYPLTMPLTTGPGTIAVMIALGSNEIGRPVVVMGVVLATLVIAGLIYACYRYADRIEGALGQTGSDALSRFFSFILICLGIQIFWNGFAELWAALPAR